jgi:deoxyribodipyrimidine photo-lyase
VFNPELQAAKFDPAGEYLDRWVPERLSPEYPPPIVDLAESRREALAAYEVVKAGR